MLILISADSPALTNITFTSGSQLYDKEVMPCVLSPLGFNLSLSVKQKIWNGEYNDLLTLLSSSKDFAYKLVKSDDKNDDDKKNIFSKSIYNWLQAFFIFSSVLCEKYPDKNSRPPPINSLGSLRVKANSPVNMENMLL